MSEPVPDRPGRPRDPRLEGRVHAAACRLYAQRGWEGTTIEAVAREAKVGKSSIYRRWADAESLLVDSLAALIELPLDIDTGAVRTDLQVLADAIADLLAGDMGEPLVRLSAEAASIPALWPRWREFVDAIIATMEGIVRKGVARRELRADTEVSVVLDALFGGLLIHYLRAADRPREAFQHADGYAHVLVDTLLRTASPT